MVTWCLVDDFANPFCRVGWEKWPYVCFLMTLFMCLLYRLKNRNRIAPFLYRLEAPRFLCGLFQEGLRRPWLKRGERQQRPCFSFQPPYLRCTTAHSSKSSSEYETRIGVERTSSLPFLPWDSLFFFLSGGWGHTAFGSHVVLWWSAASPAHPTPKEEGLRLWTCRRGGGEGGPDVTSRPGRQRGPGFGRTRSGGWGLRRDGRLACARIRTGSERYRAGKHRCNSS